MDAGLLPVKELGVANQRLAERFADDDRLEIGRALLDDALDLLEATDFLRWSVVTSDEEVERAVRDRGIKVVGDPGQGLNAALTSGIEAALHSGAQTVTILPVDVPLARSDDVRDLFDTGATSDVALVPSHSDGGTNALYLNPPDALTPSFGQASLAAHIAQAEDRGLRCSILTIEGLGLDLDTAEDAHAIAESDSRSRTARLIRKLLEEN